MELRVGFFGPIRRPWPENTRRLEVAGEITVEQLLVELGYAAADLRRISAVVNGRRSGPATRLQPGDDVQFVLLAGGG
jgi:molybdopterin converting factor small subunit